MKIEAEPKSRAGPPAHQRVYETLRDRVLFGQLAPGQPVTIQGLVQELQAGMTPVREALRRLTAEGALDALENRRICVPVLGVEALDELTEARLALEPLLVEKAAHHVTGGDIQRLEDIDSRLDHAIANGDISGYLRENHHFHAQLHTLANAPILTALVDGLWLRFGPSLRTVCGRMGTQGQPDCHKELLNALREESPSDAAQAIRMDIQQGMDMIREDVQRRA